MRHIFTAVVVGAGLSLSGPSLLAQSETHSPASGTVLNNATVFRGPDGTRDARVGDPATPRLSALTETATFWLTYGDLLKEVKGAKSLTVYAGVPREKLANGGPTDDEKKTLLQSDGQWFRPSAKPVPTSVEEQLRAAIFAGVRQGRGVKLCGGFHADVRLKWEGGVTSDVEVLICFGCSEIKLYGVTGALYADLANDQAKELRALLAPLLETRNEDGSKEVQPSAVPRF